VQELDLEDGEFLICPILSIVRSWFGQTCVACIGFSRDKNPEDSLLDDVGRPVRGLPLHF